MCDLEADADAIAARYGAVLRAFSFDPGVGAAAGDRAQAHFASLVQISAEYSRKRRKNQEQIVNITETCYESAAAGRGAAKTRFGLGGRSLKTLVQDFLPRLASKTNLSLGLESWSRPLPFEPQRW